MAPNTREMIGTIAGPFKIIERTNQKDSSKRILYRAECVCSAVELGPLSTLGKFQGHGLNCPGHPLKKGMETQGSGFTYFPDQPEHVEALAAWEAARHPCQIKEESTENYAAETTTTEETTTESASVEIAEDVATTTKPETAVETASTTEIVADSPADAITTSDAATDVIEKAPAVTQETPKAVVDRNTSTKMSAVLATRLKLTNYHTVSKKLTPPVKILGQEATSVVFAEDTTGKDLVMLHICLNSTDGKKSIVSSMRKIPTEDFSTLTSTLAEMNVTWRSKDQPQIAVAK